MNQIEIFKQEFEKMVDNIPASVDSAGYVIDEVYKILDSLNNTELPDGLEEAARAYSWWCLEQHGEFIHEDPYECFKAGAEWQYQKDRGEFAKIKAKTWCDGFCACKEQMMEKAVEGEICIPNCWVERKEGKELVIRAEISKGLGFKFGDKVRVIVIKEGEK